jgi:DNA-directed RNA polymerase specialized sigma24 family protein
MAIPPRWTKTTFLSWFEQQLPKLLHLTADRFGAELKACGLSAEDALHEALLRSICLRHYQRCRTTMRTWFLQDVRWVIYDAIEEAARTVSLGADPEPDSTSGDDAGQIEDAAASDEVVTGPSWMYVYCNELPPFIKSSDATKAVAWASYQLELRHRVARRRSDRFHGSSSFWPASRVPGDRLQWQRRLQAESWNYRNRLEALQVEAADIESTIYNGLARCTGRGSQNGAAHQPPVLALTPLPTD